MNENNQQHALLQKKNLQELKPFVDENGIVPVDGRLRNSFLDLELIHPIILPKTGSTSTPIARDYHNTVAQAGRTGTMQKIRRAGYWIINYNALVCHVIFNCISVEVCKESLLKRSWLTSPRIMSMKHHPSLTVVLTSLDHFL